MKWPCWTIAAALVVGIAWPSSAGQVRLQIHDGLVTLDARDATLREIFAEWARVGQTRVVNAENLSGGPITVQLADVSERQALETLLRSTAGFLAAPRPVPQAALSTYDRIMLMPGVRPAVSPTTAAPTPTSQPLAPWARDRVVQPPVAVVDDEDEPSPFPAMPPPGVLMGGQQQPGMPAVNPYAPAGSQPAMATPQPGTLPPSSLRPGVPTPPTTPGQPIKGL